MVNWVVSRFLHFVNQWFSWLCETSLWCSNMRSVEKAFSFPLFGGESADLSINGGLESSGMVMDLYENVRRFGWFRKFGDYGKVEAPPLFGAPGLVFRFPWVALSQRGSRCTLCSRSSLRSTLSSGCFQSVQDLMSLIATMIAMITMSTTRMMSR